ncbi:hypothetical protein ACIBHX_18220 [Nonomuraea sp. NPDC050536]|uniref:hypothetical protein n=1 Tax=Nonomuraea sp. NPDC050536 TaxID=3364366 RepID=UPI0037C5D955
MPFDPEATGVIPRLSLPKPDESSGPDEDTPDTPDLPDASEPSDSSDSSDTSDSSEASSAASDDDEDDDDETTTTQRLPASFVVKIGGPPTAADAEPKTPAVPDEKDDKDDKAAAADTDVTAPAVRRPEPSGERKPPAEDKPAAEAKPSSVAEPSGDAKPSSKLSAEAKPASETTRPAAARTARDSGLAKLVLPAEPAASPQGAATPAPAAPARPAKPAPKTPVPAKAGGLMGRIAQLVPAAPNWLPVLLTLEGLIMYVLALKVAPGPLRGIDPNDINGLGLIAAMPLSAFAAILIMIVSFFVTVAQSTDRKFLLLFQIAAITFALHGAGALVATEPRFPTAYIHAGFVEFIGRSGETAINIDARMGWPGFFALFAFVTKAAGITDLTPILQWTPLLSNLLYLLPFVLILRQMVATTRARWFAALLFILVQWIGQDYFSPQGFTFALYLAFVAILMRWFGRVEQRTKPLPEKGKIRRLLARLDGMTPGEIANTGTYRADRLLMLMLLIALFFAATASHQITPFMMLGVLTACLLFKRTRLTWALPFFLGLVVLAWISYQTVGFWAGQIDAIFGGFGRLIQNFVSSSSGRIEGSDPAHAVVLKARLGILVIILSLAAIGLIRRLRRGVHDRMVLILLCIPVLAMGLQSYGGEMGLRVYMFALPGSCLLAAYAFFPNLPADSADVRDETVPIRRRNVRFNPQLTKKLSVVLAACIAVLFAGLFLLARYGNEKFERVTTGEIAAMNYVYDHDKPSARVLYLVPKASPEVTPTLPWGAKDVDIVNFNGQAKVNKDPTQVQDAIEALKARDRNTYLVVSRGQVSYLQLNEGFPEGWGEKFRAALDASPDVKKVFSNADAALYTWKKFVKGTEIPDPQPYKGRGDPTTPWTPVGVAALAVTWIALFGHEVIRLHGPGRAPRARRRLLYVAIPAFLIALAVIIERFIYIALNH